MRTIKNVASGNPRPKTIRLPKIFLIKTTTGLGKIYSIIKMNFIYNEVHTFAIFLYQKLDTILWIKELRGTNKKRNSFARKSIVLKDILKHFLIYPISMSLSSK